MTITYLCLKVLHSEVQGLRLRALSNANEGSLRLLPFTVLPLKVRPLLLVLGLQELGIFIGVLFQEVE